jgi:hypothetical protein
MGLIRLPGRMQGPGTSAWGKNTASDQSVGSRKSGSIQTRQPRIVLHGCFLGLLPLSERCLYTNAFRPGLSRVLLTRRGDRVVCVFTGMLATSPGAPRYGLKASRQFCCCC